jgi:hypothetical protein
VFLLFGTNEKIHCQEGKNNRDSPSITKAGGEHEPALKTQAFKTQALKTQAIN